MSAISRISSAGVLGLREPRFVWSSAHAGDPLREEEAPPGARLDKGSVPLLE